MTAKPLAVTIHTDGGARGNPGPAAAGFVLRETESGQVLHEAGHYLGRAAPVPRLAPIFRAEGSRPPRWSGSRSAMHQLRVGRCSTI